MSGNRGLTTLIVIFISQYIHVSNHRVVHFKLTHVTYPNKAGKSFTSKFWF